MQISIDDTNALPEVAERLLTFTNGQKFIVFEGEMAAGKTTFIKAFCDVIGVKDVVSSPTFSIVNEYKTPAHGVVFHFDFYRLKNVQEAYDIGYEEYFYSDNFCLVEWPQKVEDLLPDSYVKVQITITGNEQRCFEFSNVVKH